MNCILQSTADPKHVARTIARVGVGLAIAFAGLSHERSPAVYATFVGRDLGFLEPLGYLWGILLPAMLILGGMLLAFGIYLHVAAAVLMTALASMTAGVMLKAAFADLEFFFSEAMPLAQYSLLWIIVVLMVIGGRCCVSESKPLSTPAKKPVPVAPAKKTVAVSVKSAKAMPIATKAKKK